MVRSATFALLPYHMMILFRVAERIFNNGFSIGEQEDFGMISSAVALYRLSLAHGANDSFI